MHMVIKNVRRYLLETIKLINPKISDLTRYFISIFLGGGGGCGVGEGYAGEGGKCVHYEKRGHCIQVSQHFCLSLWLELTERVWKQHQRLTMINACFISLRL